MVETVLCVCCLSGACVMGGFVCYDIMPRHHGIVRYRAGKLAV